MDNTDFFSTLTRLPCRLVSECPRLYNCLYRKQSENYSAKWDRGFSATSHGIRSLKYKLSKFDTIQAIAILCTY